MTTTSATPKGTKKVWRVIKWIIVIFIAIMGLAAFTQSFLGGLFTILGALFIVPIVSDKLKNKVQIWNKKYVRVIVPVILFMVGMSIYGSSPAIINANKAKVEAERIDAEKQAFETEQQRKTEERRNYVINFIQNNTSSKVVKNLNELAKIVDIYGYDKAYKGTFDTKYLIEMSDSLTGTNTIIFDPRFDFKEDEIFLRKFEGKGVLSNYVIQFVFSTHNDISTSNVFPVIYFSETDKGTPYLDNTVPDYEKLINKNIIDKQIAQITVEREKEAAKLAKEQAAQEEQNRIERQNKQAKEKSEKFIKEHQTDCGAAMRVWAEGNFNKARSYGQVHLLKWDDSTFSGWRYAEVLNNYGVWQSVVLRGMFDLDGNLLSIKYELATKNQNY